MEHIIVLHIFLLTENDFSIILFFVPSQDILFYRNEVWTSYSMCFVVC